MRLSIFASIILCVVHVFIFSEVSAGQPVLNVKVEVDFGKDEGQNFGSLFEAYDKQGNVVAGAGFLGAYNTQPRSDRGRLHFFLKTDQLDTKPVEMPRVNNQTGIYLSDRGETLMGHTRNGPDRGLYYWNKQDQKWLPHETAQLNDLTVAGKLLRFDSKQVLYDGQPVVDLNSTEDLIGENYYALGHLFMKLRTSPAKLESNRIVAIPWSPGDETADRSKEKVLQLRSDREFVYAYGQIKGQVLAATNTGGVYVFDGADWKAIVEPAAYSYQIYCMTNYYDRLLMGHYPTGEIYEYDGQTLKLLEDWPPVLEGVSDRAREAQTLSIYGGDLYCGVWPWGEVWRFDHNRQSWNFAHRMFTHPELNDKVTHPYETETKGVDKVYNLWGQRVTGIIPFDNSLFISTSSKSGFEFQEKFDFLSKEKWQDYGKVYQLTLPGQLSVPIEWKEEPTTFEFTLTDQEMSIKQDGVLKGKLPVETKSVMVGMPNRVVWGRGVYGPLEGDLISRSSNFDKPMVGAYLNFPKLYPPKSSLEEQQKGIRETLDQIKASGVNTVYPYVSNTSGAAYFESSYFEKNMSPEWDIVAYLIQQAQERELEVYPVFCVCSSGHLEPKGILEKHPEWAERTEEGEPTGFFCPTNPEARTWLTGAIAEFVHKYRTEGILFDYLRYYNRPRIFDAASETAFEEWKTTQPQEEEAALRQQYKEAGITELARMLSDACRFQRPDLNIAIYSWGAHVASNHKVGQPWPEWSNKGYIDMVNVSGYCHRKRYGEKFLEVFRERIRSATELNAAHQGKAEITFCLGVATSHGKIESAKDIDDYFQIAGEYPINGTVFFKWHTLVPYLEEVEQSEYIGDFVNRLANGD